MTDAEKQVQQANLDAEQKILNELQKVYQKALDDCTAKITELNSNSELQDLQSTIYQRQYQEMLEQELTTILDDLQTNSYSSIEQYLTNSYTNGYTGAMYSIADQGIPVISPIDQNQVVKALQTNSKLSTSLYNALGEDINYLKNSIRAELSRGIANGSSWLDMAQRIATGMNSPWNRALANAMRIARTEGHRIQQEAALDAMQQAKDKGADVVKQWDATLDNRTRPAHQEADGQIREMDEPFDVGGEQLDAPGVGGSAANVINCRCVMLQRARWALTEDELKELQDRAAYFGLDKTDDFNDFMEKYLNASMLTDEQLSSLAKVLTDNLARLNVEYNQVNMRDTPLSEEEIIKLLSGADRTAGSCASLALAYIGEKGGMDVIDFRGGSSQNFFSSRLNWQEIINLPGTNTVTTTGASYQTAANRALKSMETGKQYCLVAEKHAAIVQKTESGQYQYLELQLPYGEGGGWQDFDGNARYTLRERFGCTSTSKFNAEAYLLDVDSFKNSKDLQRLLGYINTPAGSEQKGSGGYAK